MFGRTIDRALRASEERYEAFSREMEERRERFDREMEERRGRREREMGDRYGEMERHYREEVQLTREFMRRNELVMQNLVEKIEQLAEDSRAQRQAILRVLDRMQNGGSEPAAS